MDDSSNQTPDRPSRSSRIKSADRTVEVLEFLATQPKRLTLSEIQRALGVPKTSLYGLLRTLVARGWVTSDPRGITYGIGLGALRIGTAFLDRDPTVQATAALLAHLCRQFDETMHLARLDGAEIVYLASRESRHHSRERTLVGHRLPAHATALGQAMLSTRQWTDVEQILPVELARLTADTICDRAALKAVLAAALDRGWAREEGQNTPGLVCVAVPIPSAGPSTDAISSSIPASRADTDHIDGIVRALQQTAYDLRSINEGAYV